MLTIISGTSIVDAHSDKPGPPALRVAVAWKSVEFFPKAGASLNDPPFVGDAEVMLIHRAHQKSTHPNSIQFFESSHWDDFDAAAANNLWTSQASAAIIANQNPNKNVAFNTFYEHWECAPLATGTVEFKVIERDASTVNGVLSGMTAIGGLIFGIPPVAASLGINPATAAITGGFISAVGFATWAVALNSDDDFGWGSTPLTGAGEFTHTVKGAHGSAKVTYEVKVDSAAQWPEKNKFCAPNLGGGTETSLGRFYSEEDRQSVLDNFELWDRSTRAVANYANGLEDPLSEMEILEDQKILYDLQMKVADIATIWALKFIEPFNNEYQLANHYLSVAREKRDSFDNLLLQEISETLPLQALAHYQDAILLVVDTLIEHFPAIEESTHVVGDVNQDGIFDVVDVDLVKTAWGGTLALTRAQALAGDVAIPCNRLLDERDMLLLDSAWDEQNQAVIPTLSRCQAFYIGERMLLESDPPSQSDESGSGIEQALDVNVNKKIDDVEIVTAIQLWINNEVVPGTSVIIEDAIMLDLIEIWIRELAID